MSDPGRLNRRLILEQPVESADGAGGVTRGYAPVSMLWAQVEPANARGEVAASSLGAVVTHRIAIRYRADIGLRHRLRDGDRVFRIVTIRERGRRFLDIAAEERVA